ncbi:MAG: APC family permease [Planctomycetota bacterium]
MNENDSRPATEPSGAPPVAPSLSLFDAACIIVGIVVGTSIFRTTPLVFQNTEGPWAALGIWLLGGVLCLFGAFCYAELATTYPRNGGDYEYLSRAFGRWAGFLFGWAQLTVILTGSIGVMAYAFADYAARLAPLSDANKAWLAAGAIVAVSVVNLVGLAAGKWTQNVLTVAKVLGLLGVIVAGLIWGSATNLAPSTDSMPSAGPGLGLALVFVLYAFGGWNDAAFVAAEVRNRERNLPWALFAGIAGITVVYLAVNAAYLAVLGFAGARESFTPAADVLTKAMGDGAGKAVAVLVMISALGAINGMTLAGSRVYAVVGEDHRIFAWLGRWNRRAAAPTGALLAQAAIALLLVLAVGTQAGRNAIDSALVRIHLAALPWNDYFGGFETLVAGTAPVFWAFFLMTGVAVFVLRATDGARPRPFRMPWYPLPPLIFCATCLYMLYSSLEYAKLLSLIGVIPLAIGLPLYWISSRRLVGQAPRA